MSTTHSDNLPENSDQSGYQALVSHWRSMASSAPIPRSEDPVIAQIRSIAQPDHSLTPQDGTSSTQNLQPGSKIEVKELYASGESVCTCCRTWDDVKPFVEEPDDSDITAREHNTFAVVRRQEPHGGKNAWKIHSVEVNNGPLKNCLANVFDGYPGIDVKAPTIVFKTPFAPLYHRWERLAHLEHEVEDKECIKVFRLFLTSLEPDMSKTVRSMKEFEQSRYIEFDNIPMAFIPGSFMVKASDDVLCAGILQEVEPVRSYSGSIQAYNIKVQVVDYDGQKLGVRTESWTLSSFEASRDITTLNIFPLRLHPEAGKLEEQLINRGRAFERLRGQQLKLFSGRAKAMVGQGYLLLFGHGPMNLFLSSERVVLDTRGYYILEEECPPALQSLSSLLQEPIDEKQTTSILDCKLKDVSTKLGGNEASLTDKQCLLIVPYITAFGLESKRWYNIEVSGIQDIIWTDDAINKLVLGQDEKALIQGAVSPERGRPSAAFDDFVPGKGKGIILLLCGPPGVGKTLTAEAVSEHVQHPLYRVGASDLGREATTIEPRLKDALKRCARWNAILLIDEADVFLEARSTDSLERNELVSTFLRLLEYYEGVMILTTNRISAIDPAFESRIDITLPYDDLGQAARKQIWQGFLRGKGATESNILVNEEDVGFLAQKELNGRQIKSAVKTALLLATSQGAPLQKHHLETVLHLREKAQRWINDKNTRGHTD